MHDSSGICLCMHHNFLHIIIYTIVPVEMLQYEILALLYVMTIAASLAAIQKRFSSNSLVTKKYMLSLKKLHAYILPCNIKITCNRYLKQLKAVVQCKLPNGSINLKKNLSQNH